MQLALGLEHQVDPALDREHRGGRHADQQGERREQPGQPGREVPVGIDRQPRRPRSRTPTPSSNARPSRGKPEDRVPGRTPARQGSFDRNSRATVRRIRTSRTRMKALYRPENSDAYASGKTANRTPAAEHQPDLVPVPDRADAVEEGSPLGVGPRQGQQQDADAHVEAVEDQVAGDDQDEQDEPDVIEGHGSSPGRRRGCWRREDVAERVGQRRTSGRSRPPPAPPARPGSCG